MSWKLVRGHEAQVRGFQRVIRRNRLAHAYLFTGPPGVGKRLFARELARTLLCERAYDPGSPGDKLPDACDECPACLQVEADTHPDFIVVKRPEDALEFPIEVMRDLCGRFALKPARGQGKVAVIDDADDLNEESANCFLKTLEEPPPRSVIVLIGSSPDRQLPTIVSRCQVVNFAPLPAEIVRELLAGDNLQPARLDQLVALSGGSPGVARALADPELWKFRRKLVDGLGAKKVDTVSLSKTLTSFVEEAGKESAAQRARASLCLGLLASFLQDAVRVRLGVTPVLQEPGDREALAALAARLDTEQLLELSERCLDADRHVERRVQLVLALEALMDAIAQKLLPSG